MYSNEMILIVKKGFKYRLYFLLNELAGSHKNVKNGSVFYVLNCYFT